MPLARRCERGEFIVEAAERALSGLQFRFEELFVVVNLREFAFGLLQFGLSLRGGVGGGGELRFGGGKLLLLLGGDAGAAVELQLRGGQLGGGFGNQLLRVAGAGGEDEELLTETLRFEFEFVDAGQIAAAGRFALREPLADSRFGGRRFAVASLQFVVLPIDFGHAGVALGEFALHAGHACFVVASGTAQGVDPCSELSPVFEADVGAEEFEPLGNLGVLLRPACLRADGLQP